MLSLFLVFFRFLFCFSSVRFLFDVFSRLPLLSRGAFPRAVQKKGLGNCCLHADGGERERDGRKRGFSSVFFFLDKGPSVPLEGSSVGGGGTLSSLSLRQPVTDFACLRTVGIISPATLAPATHVEEEEKLDAQGPASVGWPMLLAEGLDSAGTSSPPVHLLSLSFFFFCCSLLPRLLSLLLSVLSR